MLSVRYLAILLRHHLHHFRPLLLLFLKVYLAFANVPLDVRSSSVIDALVMVHWSA